MPNRFGSAAKLGGPVTGPMYGGVPDMTPRSNSFGGAASQLGSTFFQTAPAAFPLNAGWQYANKYGTGVQVTGSPLERKINATAEFPIGHHTSGLLGGVQGGWNPQQGINASIRIGKLDKPPEEQGTPVLGKYKYLTGLGINDASFIPSTLFAGQRANLGPEYMNAMYGPQGVPSQGQSQMEYGPSDYGQAAGAPGSQNDFSQLQNSVRQSAFFR